MQRQHSLWANGQVSVECDWEISSIAILSCIARIDSQMKRLKGLGVTTIYIYIYLYFMENAQAECSSHGSND